MLLFNDNFNGGPKTVFLMLLLETSSSGLGKTQTEGHTHAFLLDISCICLFVNQANTNLFNI